MSESNPPISASFNKEQRRKKLLVGLGGIEKKKVLEVLNPHIFFDDQKTHLVPTSSVLPSVHIPFGITNTTSS